MCKAQRGWIVVIGAMFALGLGCGASSTTPLSVEHLALPVAPKEATPVEKTFYIPGESMSFTVSLRGMVGGEATLAVGEPGLVNGKPVVVVRSRVQSAGMMAVVKEVRDEMVTWIDLDSGSVLKHEASARYGKKAATVSTNLGGGKPGPFHIDYKRVGRVPLALRQMLPDATLAMDVHATLGVLRAWDGDDAEDASFFILSGRRLWRSVLRVGAHETIRTAVGKHPAVRIDGVAQRVNRGLRDDKRKKPRNFSIWFSDDANRLPLLVMVTTDYGELRVELTDYSRPDRRITWR